MLYSCFIANQLDVAYSIRLHSKKQRSVIDVALRDCCELYLSASVTR